MRNEAPPPHPGEILLNMFMKPIGINQKTLAEHIGVSFQRINEIVNGRRGITIDTAILLGDAFCLDPVYWMDAQAKYDIFIVEAELKERGIPRIEPLVKIR